MNIRGVRSSTVVKKVPTMLRKEVTAVKGGNRKILAQIPYQYLNCYTLNHSLLKHQFFSSVKWASMPATL